MATQWNLSMWATGLTLRIFQWCIIVLLQSLFKTRDKMVQGKLSFRHVAWFRKWDGLPSTILPSCLTSVPWGAWTPSLNSSLSFGLSRVVSKPQQSFPALCQTFPVAPYHEFWTETVPAHSNMKYFADFAAHWSSEVINIASSRNFKFWRFTVHSIAIFFWVRNFL